MTEVRSCGRRCLMLSLVLVLLAGCASTPQSHLSSRPADRDMAVTAGLADFQVIQRDYPDSGTLSCQGTAQAEGAVWARVMTRDLPVPGLDWRSVGQASGGQWSATLAGIPVGGPYRIEFQVRSDDESVPAAVAVENVAVGDLWVLAGQSNMHGRGLLLNVEDPSPLVRVYGMNETWEIAAEPLHRLWESIDPVHNPALRKKDGASAGKTAPPKLVRGAGLGLAFAKELSARTQVPIGLLPCAHGGTSMSEWDPARRDEVGRSLYGSMYRRVQAVGGRVTGVLWYQGEADAHDKEPNSKLYDQRMRSLIEAVRRDFGDDDLPFYLVQLSRTTLTKFTADWMRIREEQRLIAREMKNVATVSAIDLGLDDPIHVGTPGLKRLGRRLAKVARHELFGDNSVTSGPRLKSVKFIRRAEMGPKWKEGSIRVTFENVNGRLWPARHIAGFSLRDADGKKVIDFYETQVDPDQPNAVICLPSKDMPPGSMLWYGYGLNPCCNLVDEADMAVLAFGPILPTR